MKKQVTFWIEENTRKQFSKLYNYSMSKFFRNCITLALQDKTFFHDVYFMNDFREETESDIKRQDSIF